MFYANNAVRTAADRDSDLKGEDLHQAMLAFHQLEGVIGRAFTMFPESRDQGHGADPTTKCYNNITHSIKLFLKKLKKAHKICGFFRPDIRPKFLDAGCGLGTKAFLARLNGFDAYGIDINPIYAEIAKAVVDGGTNSDPEYKNSVEVCNILEYANYGDFDCIYWYTPMWDQEKMHQFQSRVVSQLTRPTVLMPAFPHFQQDQKGVYPLANGPDGIFLAGVTFEEYQGWCDRKKDKEEVS